MRGFCHVHFYDQVADGDLCAAQSLLDIMNIPEGSSVLKFSDDSTFSASELSFNNNNNKVTYKQRSIKNSDAVVKVVR